MKRTLIVLILGAGAAVLMFAVAANLFPDWTWKVLNRAKSATAVVLGERAPAVEVSRYALPPGALVKTDQVSCPLPPQNSLYTIIVPTPAGESCAPQVGDVALNNYGTVSNPLRGWLGCIDGSDLKNVQIDALSRDGKQHLASTVTNAKGRFVFPNLNAGTYHLAVNSTGLERLDVVITTSPRSQDTLCLVATGAKGN